MKSEKTKHGFERAAERNISDSAIADAINNPLHVGEPVIDSLGRTSVKHIGKNATVLINPDTGAIITTWQTGTKIRKKYERKD